MGEGSQIKEIIERILRLKEEQDALTDDIKEIYLEAKSNGFDKTALGVAVAAIRKRAKDVAAYEERETIVGLYLAAFYGTGTAVATHAHTRDSRAETTPDHIPAGNMVPDPNQDGIDELRVSGPAVLPTPARRVADESRAPLTDAHGLMIDDVPEILRVRA